VSVNGSTPLLELRDVSASYGPFKAIFGVSFTVRHGSVLAVLGSNGGGKTTVARLCCGLLAPTDGRIVFEGEDVTGRRPYRFARLGIAHAPEGRSVFASLTVDENLVLFFRQALGKKAVADATERAYAMFPRLGERKRQVAGSLSGGEQRMLTLARVLVEEPRLLIVDELSLGLAPVIVDDVYETLAKIRDTGTALMVVEQHVRHALGLADDVIVLTKGQCTYAGPAGDLGDLSDHLLARGTSDPTGDGR